MAISRIWRAFGLKPHRLETFKLSTDPHFVEKVHDIVGLYLRPPLGEFIASCTINMSETSLIPIASVKENHSEKNYLTLETFLVWFNKSSLYY